MSEVGDMFQGNLYGLNWVEPYNVVHVGVTKLNILKTNQVGDRWHIRSGSSQFATATQVVAVSIPTRRNLGQAKTSRDNCAVLNGLQDHSELLVLLSVR